MALVFFVSSDYSIGRLSVTGLNPKIYTCSSYKTFFVMCAHSIRVFCLISTATNCHTICFARNLTIVFYNHDVGNPGLCRCNMILPYMLMSRLFRLGRLSRSLRLSRNFRLCGRHGFLCLNGLFVIRFLDRSISYSRCLCRFSSLSGFFCGRRRRCLRRFSSLSGFFCGRRCRCLRRFGSYSGFFCGRRCRCLRRFGSYSGFFCGCRCRCLRRFSSYSGFFCGDRCRCLCRFGSYSGFFCLSRCRIASTF